MRPDLLLFGLMMAVPPLTADQRPVEMSAAGGLSVDLKRHIGIAKKDVVIRRDDVTVCCDEAEAVYSGNQIEKVTCRGRVVIVRPDGTQATADLAVFLASQDQVTLSGNAQVVTPEAKLTGEKIIYDIGKDQLEVAGKKSKFQYGPPKKGAANPPVRPCPPEAS
ncbi:MAG: hypothetical protein IPG45_20075 [Deltaproteobacteria bacterium]|nr:hypothetical protein [Deltaproteobacteria bacterium]